MDKETAMAVLGELLGRKKKAGGKRPSTPKTARFQRAIKKLKTKAKVKKLLARKPSAKKPLLKAAWGRLTPAKRKLAVAAAIRKNPKLKKKLAVAVLKKRIQDREEGIVTSPGATQVTPVPAKGSTSIVKDPASAPIAEEAETLPADAVQDEMEQAPLDEAADAEAADSEAAEDATKETAAEMNENAEAEADDMAEETPEEASEETAAAADDAAEALSESAGNLLGAFVRGKMGMRRRHQAHINKCVQAARPLAGEVENLSGGAIKASHILGAVKLIAKAKKGDKKAKKGIKAVTKLAVKKGPVQKKAKKATAKLKIAHKIMKKTGTAKGASQKKKAIEKRKKALAYSKPVVVRNAGLKSYSPYQRGMAMIPGFARSHFGS